MIAKGSYTTVTDGAIAGAVGSLATDDLNSLFDRLQASGADVVQEPTEQPYAVRDCALRDPDGNLIRVNQLR